MKKTQKVDFLYEYPQQLDCKEFHEAWELWIDHRKEIRHKLTPTSVKLQFEKLKKMGLRRAIQSIHQSIENGWTGLFEPKEEKQQGWRDGVGNEQYRVFLGRADG